MFPKGASLLPFRTTLKVFVLFPNIADRRYYNNSSRLSIPRMNNKPRRDPFSPTGPRPTREGGLWDRFTTRDKQDREVTRHLVVTDESQPKNSTIQLNDR